MLFKSVLALLLLVASINSESCDDNGLDKHIKTNGSVWEINPPQNIYGNESVPPSIVRTWSPDRNSELQKSINRQINRELFAQYTYTSMAAHFDRDDIHLPGFAKFFKEAAEEEYKHAMMLIEYQNKRGGRVKLEPINKPLRDQWGNGQMAMKDALCLEKFVYDSLRKVHHQAELAGDFQMMDFIEGKFLGEQIDSIKLLGNYVNTLGRVGPGLGEYQFDVETLGGGEK